MHRILQTLLHLGRSSAKHLSSRFSPPLSMKTSAQKTASYDETKKEVTITMSVKGKNVEDEITETAPVDVVMVVEIPAA